VHYRFVYERDGTLRSVAMGVKKRGKWVVDKGQLCLYLQEPDDRCYDVALSGKTFYTDACRTGIRPGRHSPAYLRSGVSTKMSSQIVDKVSQEKAEDCVLLTYAGGQPPEGGWLIMSRIRLVARIERPRPLPNSISQPILPATLSATP
jgi:hypothetical protein